MSPRKDPRQHVYRIVEVWGFDDYENGPPVQVGMTILDKWKGRGEQPWQIYSMTEGRMIGGWTGYYLGRKEDHWPSDPPTPRADTSASRSHFGSNADSEA